MRYGQFDKLILIWKKLTSGSVNRKILGATLIVGFFTIFVKIAAFYKESIVASVFGTSDDFDAFLIALMVPTFIINLVNNSFNTAFIPIYIRVREQEGLKAAQKLFSGATIWGLGFLTITTILMLATAPAYLPWIASGFDHKKLDLTFRLLCVSAPIVFLSGISTIWGKVLNSGERFALSSISPIITPSVSILLLLGVKFWGIFTLPIGLVSGAVLEIVILGIGLHKQGLSLLPKWYGFDAHMREIAHQYAPMIAGALLICSAGPIDQSMAAMSSPGSVAALNYGNRLIVSVLSLISIALSTAIIPYFSKMIASHDWISVGHTFKQYLRLIFAITLPITVFLIVFSEPLIQLLFERGSFTDQDTHLVAQVQSFSALQTPFYIGNILVVTLIASLKKNYIFMWVSGFNAGINIICNYLFLQWMGIPGIALSTSCVYIFSFSYLVIFANKQIQEKCIC